MIRIFALLLSTLIVTTAQADERLHRSQLDHLDPGFRPVRAHPADLSRGERPGRARRCGRHRPGACDRRRAGDADALLVHDRIGEDKFVADGFGIDRRDVMYNDFVIVGPNSDPAHIRGLKDARKALMQIAGANAMFASRGDDSGTNRMELRLWKSAGLQPDKNTPWYRDLGQGMGPTLNISAAMNAYTLTDRATWANFKNRQSLEILAEGESELFNPYGSILVNPAKWPKVRSNEARTWHEWLTSKLGLDAITSYKINSEELFFPPRRDATH